ncbi:hypothetical protein HD601_003606 [Jiangella mangrovi]|uniref:Uncharacterized protein n=1 Tax=Jiangella mangrovi TaxID=1524084 RepID=A0A7W9GSP5_9ACTN|nr:hypothetical protein [Jiangella mangrovi]
MVALGSPVPLLPSVLAAGTRLKSAPSVVGSLLWLGGFDLTRVPAAKNSGSYQGDGGSLATGAGLGGPGCVRDVGFAGVFWAAHQAYPSLNTPAAVLRLG